MAQEETPKIQIDADWKAQAQAEKERLTAAEAERKPKKKDAVPGQTAEPGEQELPEASFRTLMGMLASQAVMGLGAMVDPESKGVMIDLEGARFAIDLLEVLEQKTRGNLEEEEASELRQLLAELRNRFVQVTQLIAKQAAAGGIAGAGAAGDKQSSPQSVTRP